MSFSAVDILFLATAVVYLAACVLFLLFLVARRDDGAHGERVALAGKVAPRLVGLAVAMHATHIVTSSFASHVCPVEGIHFAMSIVSMLAGAVYVVMRRRYRIDVVGVFVAPLALTFLLASRFVGTGPMAEPSPKIQSAILPFHVAANMLGVALFTLAFASAALYLVVEHLLKQKKLVGVFKRLPPLEALDRAEHRFLLAGFPLLTIGILTGTLWARHVEAGSPADIARAVFGYTSWVLFAAVLLLRAAAGWRGRRAAYGTIAGFGFTLLVLILYLIRSAVSSGAVALG
jgi:ABC-type uncharacterized transport system permease subunit